MEGSFSSAPQSLSHLVAVVLTEESERIHFSIHLFIYLFSLRKIVNIKTNVCAIVEWQNNI